MNAEPVTDKNKHLLTCDAQGNAKPGQERFLVVTTEKEITKYLQHALNGQFAYNFVVSQFHVDELHNTKSDTASTPFLITNHKNELIESICEDLNIERKEAKNGFVYNEKGGELSAETL